MEVVAPAVRILLLVVGTPAIPQVRQDKRRFVIATLAQLADRCVQGRVFLAIKNAALLRFLRVVRPVDGFVRHRSKVYS